MDEPVSLSGQILSLYERDFSPKQIALELKISIDRVRGTLRKLQSKSADSRRLFEIYELALENNAMLKQLLSEKRQREAARRIRTVEKQLPQKLGAAIDRITTPSDRGTLGDSI